MDHEVFDKEQLKAAYEAGFEYARTVSFIEIPVYDDGFEEWYAREFINPPEGWDDHHD